MIFTSLALILFPLAIIGGIGLCIYFATKVIKDPKIINFRNLLTIYIYLILTVTLAIIAYGSSLTVKASLTYPFGLEFSYNEYQIYYSTPEIAEPGAPARINEDEFSYPDQRKIEDPLVRNRDLVTGITLTSTSSLIFIAHLAGLKLVKKSGTKFDLEKIYTLFNLTLYSIAGIIALPTAIYQMINYFINDTSAITYYSETVPGEALAAAIILLPLWAVFAFEAFREFRKEKA